MAKATITVELDEEDRKRLDEVIDLLKALQPLKWRMPYTPPVPDPGWPGPWSPRVGDFPPYTPVFCETRSGTYVADSRGQTTYNV